MAQNETWLNHDLLDAVKVQYLDGNLFSMDNAGNLIGVKLTRDGVDYSGGGSVSANVIRADGGTVAVVGALSGNTATVVLPQAAYTVPGVVSIVVKLTVSGEVTTIAAVVANVYQSSTDSAIDPGTIIPSVQNLISAIQAAVASIPADYSSLWTSLAPAFSTSTNYTAGQYVTYNGALYRFTVGHLAGAWNSAHVVATNIGSDIIDLKSAISGFEITFTATSVGTKKFNIGIYKNVEYTYTNNTSASVSVNVYDAQGNATSIYGGLGSGQSVTFIATDNYVQIGGYFNVAGTVTLTCEGVAKGIKNNHDAITEQSANIDLLENITSGYSEEIAITHAQASKVHYTTMKKGVMYAIKNNTTDTVLINVYTAENVVKTITSSLSPNDTVKWIAEEDYVKISAFCNNTGTLIFYHDNVYTDIIEMLTDNDSWIQTVSNVNSGAVSALTVIDKRLYVFSYVSNNGNTTGKIFNIDAFGKLTDSGNTFTSNIGHQNTIDYSKYNHCLLASRYTMDDGITDFSVYVFQNVTGDTNEFDIANAVKLDMSSIGGDTLNAIWATNNYGRNDMIYVFTRDNENNKQYYSLVQLGKSANQLPNGTFISGVSSSAFNGTYKVLSTIEKSLTSESGVLEYINDACLHNGKIYKCVTQSMGGFAYMTDEIIGFGNAIESKEFLIPQANRIGGVPDIESEGITIHNGYLYIGSYGHGINVFKINT